MPPRGSEEYYKARSSSRPGPQGRVDNRVLQMLDQQSEETNQQLARQGKARSDAAFATMKGIGDIADKGVSAYQEGRKFRQESDLNDMRSALSEENLADEQAKNEIQSGEDSAGVSYRQRMADAKLKNEQEGGKGRGNDAVAWSHTGQVDQGGHPIMFNRLTGKYQAGDIQTRTKDKDPNPHLVTYTDPSSGETVQEFVTPEAGKKFSAKPAAKTAQEKTEKETQYRYANLKSNAGKLRQLVDQYGTVETTGSAGPEMDRLIYEMAIDYAKLVDPDSVAREGEVTAAQKYMLPIREEALGVKGAGIRNDTARQAITNYERALDDRLTSRGLKPTPTVVENKPEDGTALASSPGAAANEKIINGRRYQKVEGGWQEVK